MRRALAVATLAAAVCAGCRQDMHDQPKVKPQSASSFFPDGRGARPLVEGTVAGSAVLGDPPYLTGKQGGQPVPRAPVPVTAETLARGRERYDVFCSPCHDRVGTGDGMIVQRGYRQPPSFHIDRLRQEPDGYFFDTITNGFGVMPNYAQQIPVADRWAITLYIRALQLSQHATLADVPESERAPLTTGGGGR
jgi:cbb3-type cytochrome c oxidase subunit III